MTDLFKYGRYDKPSYECSSLGDKRFSAFHAKLPNGFTIEEFYQCSIKGYDPGGKNWRLGKGKPPLDKSVNLWEEYLKLWKIWAKNNPLLIKELKFLASNKNFMLTDRFASSEVNQARALATILNTLEI